MTEFAIVLTTCPADRDPAALATTLVEERLAACVNVLPPMASTYRWQGAVETADELDRFIAATGEVVGLTLDSGHAALGGIDPLRVIREAPERVAHVHCKDVRRSVFETILSGGGSFLDGVLEGMFTVPGDGDLDFSPLLRELEEIGYSGWIVVEAEQDPAIADPRIYARMGLSVLRGYAVQAGMEEVA